MSELELDPIYPRNLGNCGICGVCGVWVYEFWWRLDDVAPSDRLFACEVCADTAKKLPNVWWFVATKFGYKTTNGSDD